MDNYADNTSAPTASTALPQKRFMRKSLTMHNPNYYKSSKDNRIYRRTGNTKDGAMGLTQSGTAHVVPPQVGATGYDVLKPFEPIMDRKLREKGLTPPVSIVDKAKLFHNHVVAAKNFAGAKPINFETVDHADEAVKDTTLNNILTYFKSLNAGVNPDGTPLSGTDAEISPFVKGVVQKISAKVGNSGLTPQDAAALGANLNNENPAPTPFYKEPWFMYSAIGFVVLIILVSLFK